MPRRWPTESAVVRPPPVAMIIAMSTGTDVAMHAAGITLMRGDPALVADAIDISRCTYRKIRQNLFRALAYNVIGIPLAAAGLLNPVVAGAAMALSSVSVVSPCCCAGGAGPVECSIPPNHASSHNACMRRVLALLLCLLIPLQGFAAPQTEEPPCPMQAMMAMQPDAGNAIVAAQSDGMPDCCNDLATFERTGQACKTGQACTAPAVWMPPVAVPRFEPLAAAAPPTPILRARAPGAPASLWRPPSLI